MKMRLLPMLFLLLVAFLPGCATKLVPMQVESGTINPKENSQTIGKSGVTVTVRAAETDFYSYNLQMNLAAFTVAIENHTDREVEFAPDSFILVDDQARQYYALPPEKVREMIAKDSYYLIPYPYVGFYYLEDYEKSSFYNTYTSDVPYYYQMYPQEIATKALPMGPIIPGARVEGYVYFNVDFSGKKELRFMAFRKGTPKSAPPDFIFPFGIQ